MHSEFTLPDLHSARKSRLNLSPPSNFSMSPGPLDKTQFNETLALIMPNHRHEHTSFKHMIPECVKARLPEI